MTDLDEVENEDEKHPDKSEEMVGKMREEALKRKEHLKRMRMKTLTSRKDESGSIISEQIESNLDASIKNCGELPKPVFRNHIPISDVLKESELPKPVDSHITEYMEAANSQSVIDEVNLVNLAPRKPDWDLKRSVDKKLKKLDRRTQKAIAELVRDRLLKENEKYEHEM